MAKLATDGKLLKLNVEEVPNFVGNIERRTLKYVTSQNGLIYSTAHSSMFYSCCMWEV